MTALLSLLSLPLAQSARAERFVNAFKQGNANIPWEQMVLPTVIVILCAVGFFAVRLLLTARRRTPIASDRALFRELCRAHQLDRAATRALSQLVRRAELASSASIFVRPELFGDCALAADARHAVALKRLAERLFAV